MIDVPPSVPALPPPDPALRAVVVVPARDEEERIGACLAALASQRDVPSRCYEVIVVLDGCVDRTPSLVAGLAREAPELRLHALALANPRGVGVARRLGMDLACERLHALGRDHGLIASTDADSVVACDWLTAQLELADDGARAIGGLILLDEREAKGLAAQTLAARSHAAEGRLRRVGAKGAGGLIEHHQFSGASLALTAETYARCGGLPVRPALEDEALERALEAHDVAIHRSRRVRVSTSARTGGRAPRGLAGDLARADWRARRTYDAGEFPLERLLAAKRGSIALLLPAREVSETIGAVVRVARGLERAGLLDEVIVIDAASRDGTADIARAAGARVVQEDELLSEHGPALGKGDAMWRGLAASESETVLYADTDTEGFDGRFLRGMLGPLLCDPEVRFVKGSFRRPFRSGDRILAEGGGRVTELMARPLLNLHAPELAVFEQPLAGEVAAGRELLERLPFAAGYGVEIAMLIDAWRLIGLGSMAQVDLGVRQNRHQPLRDLSAMAYAVLVAAQSRFLGHEFADAHGCASVVLPPRPGDLAMESRAVTVDERPPLASLASAASRSTAAGSDEGPPTERSERWQKTTDRA